MFSIETDDAEMCYSWNYFLFIVVFFPFVYYYIFLFFYELMLMMIYKDEVVSLGWSNCACNHTQSLSIKLLSAT